MIARAQGSGERISTYSVSDAEMPAGSTIGAPKAVVTLKANGAIDRFYSIDAGETMISGAHVAFWDGATGIALGRLPGEIVVHPDRQEHIYELHNGIVVREKVFLLNGEPQRESADPAIAYLHVEIESRSRSDVSLVTVAAAELRGSLGDDVRVAYDSRRRAFTARNASSPQFARSFGTASLPSSWEVTNDHGKCTRLRAPVPLSGEIVRGSAEYIALFEHRHRLRPGKPVRMVFSLTAVSGGVRELRRVLDSAPTLRVAERRTRARYDAILKRAAVVTPDPDVNRGVLWAKADMVRSQSLAPTGWCFVNDPTRSNNSVARDTAWFAFGSDYVTPDFSRESLLAYARHLERRGMVVEYYDIRTGRTADYGLNVNDDTSLLVLAFWHHYVATGDVEFLRRVYPISVRAMRYVLSQRDARGLVWCTADGDADWGIVGWRNVIENYRISGATTELNSEAFAALGSVARMARVLKRRGDAERFAKEADNLRAAINEHLLDPETGLYYLAIDVDGTKRSNLTCDLVFPVMFGVADHESAARIVACLSSHSFWTEAGLRTVPRDDLEYTPVGGHGLLGGVWAGVTFWYAFAAARFNPDRMAWALSHSFRHYSSDPKRNNTVPGQFSEWLHGETLINQGMMLSPWLPPRYLWAAIEGAAGLDLSSGEPACNPQLAPSWKWLGVRRLLLHGRFVSWFVVRVPDLVLYSTFNVRSDSACSVYDRDVSERFERETTNDDVTTIAFQRGDDVVIFLGNTSDRSVTTSVRSERYDLPLYDVRTFNSLRGEWVDISSDRESRLSGISVQLDGGGFCLIELTKRRI
jgi:hypothetical protein